jgi:hypothetical protein
MVRSQKYAEDRRLSIVLGDVITKDRAAKIIKDLHIEKRHKTSLSID